MKTPYDMVDDTSGRLEVESRIFSDLKTDMTRIWQEPRNDFYQKWYHRLLIKMTDKSEKTSQKIQIFVCMCACAHIHWDIIYTCLYTHVSSPAPQVDRPAIPYSSKPVSLIPHIFFISWFPPYIFLSCSPLLLWPALYDFLWQGDKLDRMLQ